jgi:hypothetical protein
MVGIVHSSYYRTPSFGKKGNRPTEFTYNESKGWVGQGAVVESITSILSHEFIDCGYRLMTSYLKRAGYNRCSHAQDIKGLFFLFHKKGKGNRVPFCCIFGLPISRECCHQGR